MKELLIVFLGGGAGSICRYLISGVLNKYFVALFPIATFSANILASLIIGLLVGYFEVKHSFAKEIWLLIAIGFCGGLSTFSSFSNETLGLMRNGNYAIAFFNIIASTAICLLVTLAGIVVMKNILK